MVKLPSKTCVLCNHSLDQIGGRRILAKKNRGILLSDRPQDGGNKDFPYKSHKLHVDQEKYLVTWGPKEMWTPDAIQRAKDEINADRIPWLCQICSCYQCHVCGSPINYPMGSDVLYENGCSTHIAICPFDSGCSNPKCEKYKKFEFG